MSYLDEEIPESTLSKTKKIILAVVAVIALILLIVSCIKMNSHKLVNGKAHPGPDFNDYKINSAQAIAISRTGALEYKGTFTPQNTVSFNVELQALVTGEITGKIQHDQYWARIRGFDGRTFLHSATVGFWRLLSGVTDVANVDSLSGLFSRHWVEISPNLLGINLAGDLTPNAISHLITEHKGISRFELDSGKQDIDGTDGMRMYLSGKLRDSYARSVKGNLDVMYLNSKDLKKPILDNINVLKDLRYYVSGVSPVEVHPLEFEPCDAKKKCGLKLSTSLQSSADIPAGKDIPVSHIVDIYKEGNLLSQCHINPIVHVGREKQTKCIADSDLGISQYIQFSRENTGKEFTTQGDSGLSVRVYAFPLLNIPDQPELRKRFSEHLSYCKYFTMQQAHVDWIYSDTVLGNNRENYYDNYITGLNPRVKFHINDQDFAGMSGHMLIHPIADDFTEMLEGVSPKFHYNLEWAKTTEANTLLAKAQEHTAASTEGFVVAWVVKERKIALGLQNFLKNHHFPKILVIYVPEKKN